MFYKKGKIQKYFFFCVHTYNFCLSSQSLTSVEYTGKFLQNRTYFLVPLSKCFQLSCPYSVLDLSPFDIVRRWLTGFLLRFLTQLERYQIYFIDENLWRRTSQSIYASVTNKNIVFVRYHIPLWKTRRICDTHCYTHTLDTRGQDHVGMSLWMCKWKTHTADHHKRSTYILPRAMYVNDFNFLNLCNTIFAVKV